MSDLFEEKAKDYDAEQWAKDMSPVIGDLILSKVPIHKQMHVMDFGAGTGLISSQIAPEVDRITALDISEAMLEQLTAKPELENKVTALCQNIITNPIGEKFDLIISAFAMHHVEDTNKLIQSFSSHSKSGSWIALVDVDEEDGSFHGEDNQGVYHCGFNREELKAILKMYSFENIEFVTAHHFTYNERKFTAFLVTATKG
ncbi:class I SAM-dependent DNA methyltransferase [Desulforhopalus sp. 52FAK]